MPEKRPLRRVVVTGGAGFIGSTLVRRLLERLETSVVCYDALTYAGLRESLAEVEGHPRYAFVQGDVAGGTNGGGTSLAETVARFQPDTLLHLAAESHVDRSIASPDAFVRTNVQGTAAVLDVWRAHRDRLDQLRDGLADRLRLVHVSTDEVYGPLAVGDAAREGDPYSPSSPYSATKAAADHLVQAYRRTYGLRANVVYPTNNYGPRQLPEKLVPLATLRAAAGEPIPLYGDGQQVRDWLHVDDCCDGLLAVAERGADDEPYHLSAASADGSNGDGEWTNQRVVEAIADAVNRVRPGGAGRRALIRRVADRAGHDRRYALDSSKARRELGWAPRVGVAEGLDRTVAWLLENDAWVVAAAARL